MTHRHSNGTRLLHIIATPRGLASNTGRVSSSVLEAFCEADDDLDVTTLDLFRADLPSVAGRNIETKYRLMTGQEVDEDSKASWSEIESTIQQFLDADVYLLTVPMWNLGILRPQVLHRRDRPAGLPLPIHARGHGRAARPRQEDGRGHVVRLRLHA
ncbi:MAG TPA: NAD(P)H-dependent oxidoreductase [Candidatus Limnocylindrales bacterium]|nr:NAD(P)H-dependent oxidoreductase [Candidatus Limnocylindrales bacterium]